jgi:hypothetical protein
MNVRNRAARREFAHALFAALAIVIAGFALSACASDSGSTSTSVVTETVTTASPGDDNSSAADDGSADDDSAADSSGDIEVPDVVGKDHQLAQDTMQAAGLYNLSEEDATGQGRLLLVDRNWTVVSQSPPAGTKVNEDQTIVLRSKKDGE